MAWGFEKDRLYNRRADIHERFGGQQQGGIITPAAHPVVIIITGDEGLAHGYADKLRPDGVFEYFGEGQSGDMIMHKGNKAIADHSANGKSLLLFRKAQRGLIFEDEMVYETHHIERAPDRHGTERDAIVFEIRPLSAVAEAVEQHESARSELQQADLTSLRRRAYEAAGVKPGKRIAGFRNVYERSEDVRGYVLARAKGACEGCRSAAPFKRKDGSPYLEPHHIRRVSDGGPDDPSFVIALCPNCHRRVHAGDDGPKYNDDLLKRMATIEAKPFPIESE